MRQIASGSTLQVQADLCDTNLNVIPGVVFVWTLKKNTRIARISKNGLIYGLKVGTTTIYAKANGLTGTSSITVTVGPPDSV